MSRVILAAVSRGLQDRISSILHECELQFVHTGAQLAHILDEEGCDMVIVGMQLDEPDALAALERLLSRTQSVPVVYVRGLPSGRLGAQNFIDLLQYPDDALGNAHLRAMLERLLPR